MEKEKIIEKQTEIIRLTTAFCTEIIKDKEYAQLAEKLVKKMGRKRNVPFETGKAEIWAAAVIHALGSINFLFDKSFQPYTTIDEINKFFDTNKTTTGAKSKFIRDLFNLGYWDNEFSTERMSDNNPFAGLMMSANGFIVPANSFLNKEK